MEYEIICYLINLRVLLKVIIFLNLQLCVYVMLYNESNLLLFKA